MNRHSITAATLLAVAAVARMSFAQSTQTTPQEGPPVEPASAVPS